MRASTGHQHSGPCRRGRVCSVYDGSAQYQPHQFRLTFHLHATKAMPIDLGSYSQLHRNPFLRDLEEGRERNVRIDVSTALSILMKAMRLSNAVFRCMCESACRKSSTAPDAHVLCISYLSANKDYTAYMQLFITAIMKISILKV